MNISFGSNYSSDLNSLVFSRKGDKEVAIPENIADTRNVYEAAFGGLFDLQENALLTELFGSKTPDARQLLAARLILDNEMALTKENVAELKSYILQYPDVEPSIPAVMMKNDIPINSYSVAEMQKYISGRIGFESAFLEMEKELEVSGMGDEFTGNPAQILSETDSGVALGTEYGVVTETKAGKAEVGKAESGKTEAEIGKTEVGKLEAGKAVPEKTEVGKAETGKTTVDKAEIEAGKREVGKLEAGKAVPEKTEVGKAETGKTTVGKAEAEIGKTETEVPGSDANGGNTALKADAQGETAAVYRLETDDGQHSHESNAVKTMDSAIADEGKTVKPDEMTGNKAEYRTYDKATDEVSEKTGDKWGDKSVIRSEGKLFIRHTDFSRKELERFNEESRELIRRVIAQTENNPSRASLHSKAQAALKAFNAMVDINSVFPHAYIPFKMENKLVNAGLFVYTNKKTKAPDPQHCTALLHLDMPSLGPTDIFLRLNSNRLGTEFKANEEAVKLLKKEFPSLEGRLKKLGFAVEGSFTAFEDKKDAPKDSEQKKITADASEKDSLNEVKRISDADSFDVRA